MNKLYVPLAVSIVGLSLLTACGKEETKPVAPPAPPSAAPTATPGATPTATPTALPSAAPTAEPSVAPTPPTSQQIITDLNNAAPTAGDKTKTASAALTSEAQKLLTDATVYIKDKKFDLADQAVTKLTEMKPHLPAEYGPRIDQLRIALEGAKAANSFKLPGAK